MTKIEFNNAIKLAQGRINSRPLIALSDDERYMNLLIITPFHLKLGRASAMLPSSVDNLDNESLAKIKLSNYDRWMKRKLIHQQFFIRWKNEYLPSLSKNKGITDKKEIKRCPVVLILNERTNRDDWPLAGIEQVFKSKEGIVRSAQLRLPLQAGTKGNKNCTKSDNRQQRSSYHFNSSLHNTRC